MKGNIGNNGDSGSEINGEKGNKNDNENRGESGINGDTINPIDVYAFANNTASSINVVTDNTNSGKLYFPNNNIASGISIEDINDTTTFMYSYTSSVIYLATYNILISSTITSDTQFILHNDSNNSKIFPGSIIQPPYGYQSDTFFCHLVEHLLCKPHHFFLQICKFGYTTRQSQQAHHLRYWEV